MDSFKMVIEALGDYVQVAQALGITPGTVSSMKSRDSIPPTYWHALTELARAKDKPEINLDTLARLYAAKPAPSSDKQSPAQGQAA
jgi:hypothetical protein